MDPPRLAAATAARPCFVSGERDDGDEGEWAYCR